MNKPKVVPAEVTPMQVLERKVTALAVAGVALALVMAICILLVFYFWL